MRFPRKRFLFGAVACAVALGAAAAAVVKYVNVDRLDVVDRKRAVAKTVATLDRGAALNVIATEGRWLKVEVGGKEGYVAETVVSDTPQGKKGQSVSLGSIGSGSNPALESAAAVKGVGPGGRAYASSGGYNTRGLEEMIRRRDAITPAEFDSFVETGRLTARPADAEATRVASSEVTR